MNKIQNVDKNLLCGWTCTYIYLQGFPQVVIYNFSKDYANFYFEVHASGNGMMV